MAPKQYDKNLGKYSVYGNFCSWQCIKRFILDQNTTTCAQEIMYMSQMAREIFGVQGSITAALPRFVLGTMTRDGMTIEEYRAYSVTHTETTTVRETPPFSPFTQVIEEVGKNTHTRRRIEDARHNISSIRGLCVPEVPVPANKRPEKEQGLYEQYLAKEGEEAASEEKETLASSQNAQDKKPHLGVGDNDATDNKPKQPSVASSSKLSKFFVPPN